MTYIVYSAIAIVSLIIYLLIRQAEKDRKQAIEDEIGVRESYLAMLENEVQNTIKNPNTNMTKTQDRVLDLYENSNIRIPLDVLDSMIQQGNIDENDLLNYIENQRHFWKLENSKKLYVRK